MFCFSVALSINSTWIPAALIIFLFLEITRHGGENSWQIVHLLCSDTVPKYRVENGAAERSTVRTINIHSPSTEGWQKPGPRRNSLFSLIIPNVAPLSCTGFTYILPLFFRFGCFAYVPVPFWHRSSLENVTLNPVVKAEGERKKE